MIILHCKEPVVHVTVNSKAIAKRVDTNVTSVMLPNATNRTNAESCNAGIQFCAEVQGAEVQMAEHYTKNKKSLDLLSEFGRVE